MGRVLLLFAIYFALFLEETRNGYHSMKLHKHSTKNQSKIVKIMGVNQSTVSRILKQAREIDSSSPNRKGRYGRYYPIAATE